MQPTKYHLNTQSQSSSLTIFGNQLNKSNQQEETKRTVQLMPASPWTGLGLQSFPPLYVWSEGVRGFAVWEGEMGGWESLSSIRSRRRPFSSTVCEFCRVRSYGGWGLAKVVNETNTRLEAGDFRVCMQGRSVG